MPFDTLLRQNYREKQGLGAGEHILHCETMHEGQEVAYIDLDFIVESNGLVHAKKKFRYEYGILWIPIAPSDSDYHTTIVTLAAAKRL